MCAYKYHITIQNIYITHIITTSILLENILLTKLTDTGSIILLTELNPIFVVILLIFVLVEKTAEYLSLSGTQQ